MVLSLVPALAAAQTPPPPGLVPVYPPGVSPGSPHPPSDQVTPGSVAYPPPGYPVPSLAPSSATPTAPPAPPSYRPYYVQEPRTETLPLKLPYEDGQSVPHGYRVASRAMRSYVIAGAVSFGASWAASVIGAGVTLSNEKGFAPLFAPVVGPFVAVGSAASTGAGTVWLVLDGLAQTGGVVLFAYGLAAEEKFLEREASGRATPLDVLAHPEVALGGSGLTMRWTM